MTKYALTLLAAAMLAQPMLSVAGDKPSDCDGHSSSFVPHAHTSQHVYGTPIQPPILHHRKTSHHLYAPKKRSSGAAIK
jgi:hypothetical protein